MKVLYVRASQGGIADYGAQIEAIYRANGIELEVVTVAPGQTAKALHPAIDKATFDVAHFEVGAGDNVIVNLSQYTMRTKPGKQLMTLHDPGVVVYRPLKVSGTDSSVAPVRLLAKVLQKTLNLAIGRRLLQSYLQHPDLIKVYLRADLADGQTSFYLPQPTYHSTKPKALSRKPITAFSGYWGVNKGLETLLEAWELLDGTTGLELVIAGATGDQNDPYALEIQRRIKALKQPVTVTGFIAEAELDNFLGSLTALVLPYWPELPSGTSAMSMRAAELATPIIASDTPALHEQLGAAGALYVPPKDSQALAEAIRQLDRSPQPYLDKAAKLQTRIFAEHNADEVGKALMKIVEQAK